MKLADLQIKVHDPLATVLGGPAEVEHFSLSLLDVARFSGHLCPSVAGAFLVVSTAVNELFEDQLCVRGLIKVEMPGTVTDGANGPISNVIGYLTGAWSESGFGGLRGEHRRRNLLSFEARDLLPGQYRFSRIDTGRSIQITYNPQKAIVSPGNPKNFQEMWQAKVRDILSSPSVIQINA